MSGRIAAVILLTVALLNDQDCLFLWSTTSGISGTALNNPSRRAQNDARLPGLYWPMGAWASPLLALDQEQKRYRDHQSSEAHVLAAEDRIVAEEQWTSTGARWRTFENATGQFEAHLATKLESPGRTNVPMGWVDPRLRGGQMLDFTLPGKGEPLNVIISGLSDPYVLTPRGLLHYAQTLGFSIECLGIHIGQLHIANLGDSVDYRPGRPAHDHVKDDFPYPREGGNKTEQLLARQNYDWPLYGWPDYGTCWESLVGGNHFRAWKQDGAGARTNAWFLAVSKELWLGAHHDIASDGYNGGRDALVARALKPTRWSPTQEGIWWQTDVYYNTSLLAPGKEGVNHAIAQDGRVAILTVRRRPGPPSFNELHDAWGEIAAATDISDPDIRIESQRARWELQISPAGGEIYSRSWWNSVLRMIYRTWALTRDS